MLQGFTCTVAHVWRSEDVMKKSITSYIYVPRHICRGQRTAGRSQSCSTLWVPGLIVRPSGLAVATFTHWVILLAPNLILKPNINHHCESLLVYPLLSSIYEQPVHILSATSSLLYTFGPSDMWRMLLSGDEWCWASLEMFSLRFLFCGIDSHILLTLFCSSFSSWP